MKNIIIVGAGAFAREIYGWGENLFEIKGFLGDKHDEPIPYGKGIINTIEEYIPQPTDLFLSGVGTPQLKNKLNNIILNKGGHFINLIHPSVIVGKNIKIGTGVVICPNCVISDNVKIGNFVSINSMCSVGHDVVLGDYCQINVMTNLAGYVKIGGGTTTFSSSTIMPKINIGENCTVGIGSVVIKNVPSGYSTFGNPARAFKL